MTTTNDHYILYHYNPSTAAADIFAVLFGITSIFHGFQLIKNRTWYFIPFLIGALFEFIGYIGRVVSSRQSPNWAIGPYIIQSLLTLLAPLFFAASIYMILGRIIRLTDGESHAIVKARWCTKVFVAGDVLSFLTQSSGGGMLAKAKDQSSVDLGQHIIIAGLLIQLFFFTFFIFTIAVFHRRILRYPTGRSLSVNVNWKLYIIILYVASALIMVRSAFRTIEYAMGQNAVLSRSEVYLYVFDACLMLLVCVLFNWKHPSEIITHKTLELRGDGDDAELGGVTQYGAATGRK